MATPAQGSCLEDPTDRGAGRASPQGHKESDTTEVTEHTHTHAVCTRTNTNTDLLLP